jgi:hypothetical protein
MSPVVDSVAGRIVETYGLIFSREKAEAARPEIIKFLDAAAAKGETDEERLAVDCMKYLRKRDQRKSKRRQPIIVPRPFGQA